jgi:hypothetical protein
VAASVEAASQAEAPAEAEAEAGKVIRRVYEEEIHNFRF